MEIRKKMKKILEFMNQKNGFAAFAFHMIALFWVGILFHYALELTGRNLSYFDEYITILEDFILKNVLRFGIGLLGLFALGWVYDRYLCNLPKWVLPLIACIVSGVVSILWVYLSKSSAVGDQMEVLGCATEYNLGQRFMLERGRYMSIYSQNLGLMTLERVLVVFFGKNPQLQFQYMVALLVPVGVLSGYHVTGYLSGHNPKAQHYYLLLMLTCFPMYGYVPYVYGDLISVIALLGTVWCLFSCFEHCRWYKLVLLGALAGTTVQLRTNMLVPMIGIGIVILVMILRKKGERKKFLLTGLSFVAGILLFYYGILAMYHIPKDAERIPAVTYLYMGMNDTDGIPGWYDSSGFFLFVENNFDSAATKKAAWERMQPYLERFKNDPAYLADFLHRKIVMQWEEPLYQCFVMTRTEVYEQIGRLADQIYYGEGIGLLIIKYMKYYQLLLYGGILLWLVKHVKRGFPIENYVLLIGAFGGFLFSLIWEAKTRYVFPYFMMMIPYLAVWAGEAAWPFRGGKTETDNRNR